jgi:hypothetical protein
MLVLYRLYVASRLLGIVGVELRIVDVARGESGDKQRRECPATSSIKSPRICMRHP